MNAARSGRPQDVDLADSLTHAAELKLTYAFEQELELALVVGGTGLGKTTLLRRFTSQLALAGHAIVDVYFPQLSVDGLLAFIAAELDDMPAPDARREDSLRRIAQRVRRLAEQDRALAIVIDDAHLVNDVATFEALQLLLNLRERENARLIVVMAGQRGLVANLSRVPAVAQRVGVTATLLPLDVQETLYFAQQLLQATGHDGVQIENDAMSVLHELTCGSPRTIRRLCEMATLIAATNGTGSIGIADLRMAATELPRLIADAA